MAAIFFSSILCHLRNCRLSVQVKKIGRKSYSVTGFS